MVKTQYKVISIEQSEFPPRELVEISGDRTFTASLPAFGPATYKNNQLRMQETYSHPQTGEKISFKPATSAEGILITNYEFKERAKPKILDPRWLQLAYILKGKDGVFVNLPKDKDGNPISDEKELKLRLDKCEKVNGIYLYKGDDSNAKDFGFAPYETFKQIIQEGREFAESGLARVLEHTSKKQAEILGEIASKQNYLRGVNVCGFGSDINLMVASLDSDGGLDAGRLDVYGGWGDGGGDDDGYAFGVL